MDRIRPTTPSHLSATSATRAAAPRSSIAESDGPSDSIFVLAPLETPKDAVETLVTGFGYAEFPQVSPDGKTVVFNVVGDYETSQMLRMKADGSKVRALVTGEKVTATDVKAFLERHKGRIDEQGTFSADGKTLFYRSNEKGTFGLAKFDLEGGEAQMLVHDPSLNIKHPAEMADGWLVAYGGPPGKKFKTSEEFSDILLANPKDGSFKLITHSDGTVAYKHPSAMNGMILAHKEPRGSDNENGDLVQIDPRTGAEINLTQTPDASEKHPFYNQKVGLVTFHSDENDDKNIWIGTPDVTRRVPITLYGKAAQSPCWSPDGKKIFFVKKGERQADGEPFFARQADIRVIDVKAALKDLTSQAKTRLKDLEARGASDPLIDTARKSYEDYKFFRDKY